MKIGLDFRLGGVQNGGIGRYSSELFLHVIKQYPKDEFFIFFHPKRVRGEDLVPFASFKNVKFIPAPFRHYSIAEQIGFPRLLARYNLDIVHFPNFNVPVRYKGKFVVTIHDVVHHTLSGHKKKNLIYFYGYKYVIEQAVKNSQKIITVSESSKADIISVFNVPDEKVEVIYEGVTSTSVDDEFVEKVTDQFLLPRPYFLFAGVLERKKNIILLCKAFDIFVEKYQMDMDLVIAGKTDPHYPEIRGQALAIKNKHRVIFTGFVTDEELAALYTRAYAFVTASLHEGFGLPALEAMSHGIPVLAANTSTFNEVYDNAAIYFNGEDPSDIADKMYLLAKDPKFYEQCQVRSLARVAGFSWEAAAGVTYRVYREAFMNMVK